MTGIWDLAKSYIAAPTIDPADSPPEFIFEYLTTLDGRRRVLTIQRLAWKLHLHALRAAEDLYRNLGEVLVETQSFFPVRLAHGLLVRSPVFLSINRSMERWLWVDAMLGDRFVIHLQYSGTECLQWLCQNVAPMSQATITMKYLDEIDRKVLQQAKQSGRRDKAQKRVFLPATNACENEAPEDHVARNEVVDKGSKPRNPICLPTLLDMRSSWTTSSNLSWMTWYWESRNLDGYDLSQLTDAQYYNLQSELNHEFALEDHTCIPLLDDFILRYLPSRPKKRVALQEIEIAPGKCIHPTRFAPESRFKLSMGPYLMRTGWPICNDLKTVPNKYLPHSAQTLLGQ